ncbi:hypothetical protein VTK56DRAFT_3046 [Thermocarpiscus australiensis]
MAHSSAESLLAQLDAWILEDTHVRKVVRFEGPRQASDPDAGDNGPRKPTPTPGPTKPPTNKPSPGTDEATAAEVETEKEQAALRLALELAHQRELQRTLLEQKRLEAEFREVIENKKKMKQQQQQLEEKIREMKEKEEKAAELEREALRRAVEEMLRRARRARRERERALREQAALEAEIRAERERRERKAEELEKAAVARAVEESIVSEAARELLEEEERERERRRREAERAQEEMLRQWKRGGDKRRETKTKVSGAADGFRRCGSWVFPDLEDDVTAGGFPRPAESHSTLSGSTVDGRSGPFSEPAWRSDSPSPRLGSGLRATESETDAYGFRRWQRESERRGETETAMWRETATERWETVTRREEEEKTGHRRCRVTGPKGRFL